MSAGVRLPAIGDLRVVEVRPGWYQPQQFRKRWLRAPTWREFEEGEGFVTGFSTAERAIEFCESHRLDAAFVPRTVWP